jgi:hypothetical protein
LEWAGDAKGRQRALRRFLLASIPGPIWSAKFMGAKRQEARMRNLSVAMLALAGCSLAVPVSAGIERVPKLNVAQSCREAQEIAGEDKNLTYKGCMQDEMAAQKQLAAKWSRFKAEDRRNCVEGGAAPLPSYVEILTCLEMYDQASTLYRPADKYAPTQIETAPLGLPESVPPASSLPSETMPPLNSR